MENDKRSLEEIFQDYGTRTDERRDLYYELTSGLHVSRQTVDNWRNGKVEPHFAVKQQVARIVSRVLNIRTTPLTLFPHRYDD